MKFGWDPIGSFCHKSDSILIESIIMQDKMEIFVNGSSRIQPLITPINASNKRLKWSSSDTTVAHVDTSGLVITTSKVGTCIITASANDRSGKYALTRVDNIKPEQLIPVDSIIVKDINEPISLIEKETQLIKVDVLPGTATNKVLSWDSSDKDIAQVDANGIVKAKKTGTCTINISSTDGSDIHKSIIVHVRTPEPPDIKVTSCTFGKSDMSMKIGERTLIRATLLPTNASNKALKWQSSNSGVATVNNGNVVAVGTGDCVITAYTTDGSRISSQLKLHVSPILISSISLKDVEVELDNNISLKATIMPLNATNRRLEWSSSDPGVVSVNSKGVVTGKQAGKQAIITAKSTDGSSAKASCTVKVYKSAVLRRDLDLGYAVYTGRIYNGKPGKDGIITFKKDCTISSQNGYIKFSKGDKIRVESYSVNSDKSVVILGDLVTPGKEKSNLYLYIYPD